MLVGVEFHPHHCGGSEIEKTRKQMERWNSLELRPTCQRVSALCTPLEQEIQATAPTQTSLETTLQSELDRYKLITETFTSKINDPIKWWSENRKAFPVSSKIAISLFVIQASSAKSERHCSAFNARHIITPLRNWMAPEIVEAVFVNLESFKNNLL